MATAPAQPINRQWRELVITPVDKFNIAQRELNLLLQEGRITRASYAAAIQKAREEEAKATDQLEKLLAKTDSVEVDLQAFFRQLEQQCD